MFFRPRPQRRSSALWLFPALLLLCLPSWAAEKLHFHADDYEIDAVLNPHEHKIAAHAKVKIPALEDLNIASFHLHNLLRLTKVSDAAGKPLTADRMTQDSSVGGPMKNTLHIDSCTSVS